jgi:hypothetical protein
VTLNNSLHGDDVNDDNINDDDFNDDNVNDDDDANDDVVNSITFYGIIHLLLFDISFIDSYNMC